jgi:hypothetical protein
LHPPPSPIFNFQSPNSAPPLHPVPKPGAPAETVLTVDGKEVARTSVKMTVPAVFTASETLDFDVDLGSLVSRDYTERRSFKFDGKIGTVKVELK